MLRHALQIHGRTAVQGSFGASLRLVSGGNCVYVRPFASSHDDKRKLFVKAPPAVEGVPPQPNNKSAAGLARQLSSARLPEANSAQATPLSALLAKKPQQQPARGQHQHQHQQKNGKQPAKPAKDSNGDGMISSILKSFGSMPSQQPAQQKKNTKQHNNNHNNSKQQGNASATTTSSNVNTNTSNSINANAASTGQKGGLLNHTLQDSFSRKKKLAAEMQEQDRSTSNSVSNNSKRSGGSNQQHNQQMEDIQASANAIADNLLELIQVNKAQGKARWERREADIERKRNKRRANMPDGPSSVADGVMLDVSQFKSQFGSKLAAAEKRGKEQAKAVTQQQKAKQPGTVVKEVEIPDTGMTARELAIAMSMKSKDLLKALRALGETIKDDEELLEADVAEILVLDQGLQVKRVKTEKDFNKRQLREASTQPTLPRAPVVCVMGHVDHGKTSLLDALRKTNVAAGEAGGITQRLAAFSVDMNNFVQGAESTANRSVVFLDTPGHAAFSAMRAHGAHATDIACIIVAAVEGVQPQTIESINFAKEGGASIVVAISKIDRIPEEQRPSTIAKIKAQLADLGVVSEDFGGEVPVVAISSVTGYGLQELVEQLLLQAEMLELQAVQEGAAQSVVLDTNTEKGVGFVADVLVQWGKLRVGDVFVVGNAYGRVRQMTDAFGNQITEALPSTPVRITGLKSLPDAGEELLVVEDESRARDIAARRSRLAQMRQMRERQAQNGVDEDSPCLHVMLKADTHGTMDALHQIVTGINDPEIQIKIVGQGIGPITRSDIQMAMLANRCPIMCFNVGFGDTNTKNFAKEEDVPCSTHNIIYRIEDEIKNMILAKLPKVPILEKKGTARVQQIFQLNDKRKTVVAGCIVSQGVLRAQGRYRVVRGENPVTDFIHLESLRRHKDVVQEVSSGSDCGVVFSKFDDVRDGDTVEFFEIVQKPKRLVRADDILFEPEASAQPAEAVSK